MKVETPKTQVDPDGQTLDRLCGKVDEYGKLSRLDKLTYTDPELDLVADIAGRIGYPGDGLLRACEIVIPDFDIEDPVHCAYVYASAYLWNRYIARVEADVDPVMYESVKNKIDDILASEAPTLYLGYQYDEDIAIISSANWTYCMGNYTPDQAFIIRYKDFDRTDPKWITYLKLFSYWCENIYGKET